MKRFVISFLTLTVSLLSVFAIQITAAQTFPNMNPPTGDASPNFSGLNVTGNIVVGGTLEVGNTIKPKGTATTLGVNGKLSVSKGLDVTGTVNVSDELNVNQFFTASKDLFQVKIPTEFNNVVNLNSNVNLFGGDIAIGGKAAFSGILIGSGKVQFPNGADIGAAGGTFDVKTVSNFTKNVNIGDAYVATLHTKTAGQPIAVADKFKVGNDLEVTGKTTAANLDVTGTLTAKTFSPSSLTSSGPNLTVTVNDPAKGAGNGTFQVTSKGNFSKDLDVTGNITASAAVYGKTIGNWKLAEGKTQVSGNATGPYTAVATCDAGYIILSCNGYWDMPTSTTPNQIRINPANNSCSYTANLNTKFVIEGKYYVYAQGMCFKAAK